MVRKTNSHDRQNVLFGRQRDLDNLVMRVEYTGLTAVIGEPKIGKSSLLRKLTSTLQDNRGYLVGYEESAGETSDLMLRAVSDLYARWLIEASYKQQAQTLWKRHREKFVARFGEAFVQAFDAICNLTHPTLSVLGTSVAKVFSQLSSLDQDLKTGGLTFTPLTYDQSRDLIEILAHVTERPICLILDAWEQSPSVSMETSILSKFLGNLSEWPRTHIVVGSRTENAEAESWKSLQDLNAKAPSEIMYELGSMELDSSETSASSRRPCA